MDTYLAKLLCTEKQNIGSRIFRYMVAKSSCKMILIGVADHNKFFPDSQILIQQVFVMLKIALAALIEDIKICAGIITIIGDNEICKITPGNFFADGSLRVAEIRTRFSLLKTRIAALPAWRDPESGKVVNDSFPFHFPRLPDDLCDAAAIPRRTSAERHDAHFHCMRPHFIFTPALPAAHTPCAAVRIYTPGG